MVVSPIPNETNDRCIMSEVMMTRTIATCRQSSPIICSVGE